MRGAPRGIEAVFAGKKRFHKAMAGLTIMEKLAVTSALQRIDFSIKPAKWKKRMMWRIRGQNIKADGVRS